MNSTLQILRALASEHAEANYNGNLKYALQDWLIDFTILIGVVVIGVIAIAAVAS